MRQENGKMKKLRNGEIIEVSKPEGHSSEGLQIQLLVNWDNTFRGLNIQEHNKEGTIIREVFIHRETELENLVDELLKLKNNEIKAK